jgi:RNA polymerase sigma factor (sigma-70 family)
MSTTAIADTRADAELISAVRGGDVDAYGVLFERHADAARKLSRQLVSAGDADDLVSEAFVKVLTVLQRGGGPDIAFRAYLLTAVRRLRVDRIRATSKLHTTDDMEMFDPGVPFRDTTIEGFENAAAARAFASLPERWQLVLWHTEVEEQKPADIAPLLGMTPNSVSALAYRAREGLRQAFLNEHVTDIEGEDCRWTHDHLGPYIRNGLSRRDVAKVDRHLEECRPCAGIYLELVEVNSNLGAIIGPLLLGSAAVAYLTASSATSAVSAGGLLVSLLDRGKDLVAAHAPVAAVGGVTTAAAIAGLAFVTLQDDARARLSPGDSPAAVSAPLTPGQPASTSRTAGSGERRTANGSAATEAPSTTASPSQVGIPGTTSSPSGTATPDPTQSLTSTGSPTSLPTSQPTSGPTSLPTTQPTSQPTSQPTGQPTGQPTAGNPTSTPTSSPTGAPTSKPTQAPSPTPTATPTPTPTQTAVPLTRDLGVSITTVDRKALYEDLAVTTTGIPTGETATVIITGVNAMDLTTSDGRCRASAAGIVCTVAGSAPIAIRAQRIPNGNASVTVVVASNDGADSNPANNATTMVLDSN